MTHNDRDKIIEEIEAVARGSSLTEFFGNVADYILARETPTSGPERREVVAVTLAHPQLDRIEKEQGYQSERSAALVATVDHAITRLDRIEAKLEDIEAAFAELRIGRHP